MVGVRHADVFGFFLALSIHVERTYGAYDSHTPRVGVHKKFVHVRSAGWAMCSPLLFVLSRGRKGAFIIHPLLVSCFFTVKKRIQYGFRSDDGQSVRLFASVVFFGKCSGVSFYFTAFPFYIENPRCNTCYRIRSVLAACYPLFMPSVSFSVASAVSWICLWVS